MVCHWVCSSQCFEGPQCRHHCSQAVQTNRLSWTAWPQRLRQHIPFKSWKLRTQCQGLTTESLRAPLSELQSSFITSAGLSLPTCVLTE